MHILSRHILTRFPLLMLLLTLGACSSDNGDGPQPESRPTAIAFAPKVGDEATRAGITYAGNDINTLNKSGFGVFCYYSGASNYASATAPEAQDVVMNNVKVWRADGATTNWQYAPKRFWPSAGNKLSFFAYAPYMGESTVKTGKVPTGTYSADGSNGNKMELTSYADGGVYYPAINYYATDKLDDQNDLLWGTDDRGAPFANADIAKYPNGYIYFQMCHALARLQLYITSTEDYSSHVVGTVPDGWQYQDYDTETRLLVKSVTIGNQYGQGTLVLNNTEAFRPQWVNKTGIGGTKGNWLAFDLKEHLNTAVNVNDNNLANDWDNHTGVTKDTTNLLTNNRGVLVIPKLFDDLGSGDTDMKHTTVTVVSQRVTLWTNNTTGEKVLRRGVEVTRTATLKDGQDLLGGHSYRVNLNIKAKYLELTLKVQPWTLAETVFTDVNKPVTITVPNNGKLNWPHTENYDIDDRDSLSKGLVYINSHHATATFQITAPQGATWTASLVPVKGNDNAFVFMDKDGNTIGNPSGPVGVGDDHRATIYVRAANLTTAVENRALLRFYVKTAGGQTAIVRNLVPENNGKFTEYQVVQRINQ
jgi:hypothetical protein